MTHTIQLERYHAVPQSLGPLCLGTADSYGIEQLQLQPGQGWQGLTLSVTFHPPGGRAVRVLADGSGRVTVPPEATADSGYDAPGRLVIAGAADGVRRISTDLEYRLLPHADPSGSESAGVSPTTAEQLLAKTAALQTALDQLSLTGQGLLFAGGYLGSDGCLHLTDAAGQELSPALYTPIPLQGAGGSGGYYTPAVTQPDASTLQLTFTPSSSAMAAVPAKTLTLPAGPQGEQGATGATPRLTVGTVTTLPAGQGALASITGTAEAPVLHLSIPRGADGEDGADGAGCSGVPDWVTETASTAADAALARQSGDSVLLAFLADGHCGLYTDPDNTAVTLAGQLLRGIDSRCPLDLVVHGGDVSTGAWDTTADDARTHAQDYTALTALTGGTPALWCIGNHDDAPYRATVDRLNQTQTAALFGRKNLRAGAVCPAGANYGYLDLENRRLRVIVLDTDDKRGMGSVQVGAGEAAPAVLNAHNIGPAQLAWLANTALDFSAKADPAAWAVVVVSHVPLDVSGTETDPVTGQAVVHSTAHAAAILGAYARGESGGVLHEGQGIGYDFTAADRAQVWCLLHGHEHRFTSRTLQGILSIGCPNLCDGRERESDDGVTYAKTAGTARGTSFCLITLDRQHGKIYADCCGAGPDREWEYTPVGGSTLPYTNRLPLAIDANGSVYNGVGYKEGFRLDSSGGEVGYDGYTVTGFMPCAFGDIVRLQGVTLTSGDGNQRLSFYDAGFQHLAQTNGTGAPGTLEAVFGGDGSMTWFKVQSFGGVDLANVAWFRLNGTAIAADAVITVNEEIG